jgi:hypothetical protein
MIYDYQSLSVFDSFKGLTQLRDLSIDLDSLVPPKDYNPVEAFSEPYKLFPDSLLNLTIDGIHVREVARQSRMFHRNLGEVNNLSEAVSQALRQLAAKFALKRLTLSIIMETVEEYLTYACELEPEDVVFFRYAADELLKIGLRFEVYREPNSFSSSYALLVEPGWMKRLPHAAATYDASDV